MVRYSTLDRRYTIVVGSVIRYADTIADAIELRDLLVFGDKLLRILPKVQ